MNQEKKTKTTRFYRRPLRPRPLAFHLENNEISSKFVYDELDDCMKEASYRFKEIGEVIKSQESFNVQISILVIILYIINLLPQFLRYLK